MAPICGKGSYEEWSDACDLFFFVCLFLFFFYHFFFLLLLISPLSFFPSLLCVCVCVCVHGGGERVIFTIEHAVCGLHFQPLIQCYKTLKESGLVFQLQISETWMRDYQVPPAYLCVYLNVTLERCRSNSSKELLVQALSHFEKSSSSNPMHWFWSKRELCTYSCIHAWCVLCRCWRSELTR